MEKDLVNYAQYFEAVAEIWQSYSDGLLSMNKRDAALAAYRRQLPSLRPSPFAAQPSPFA